ncbi:cation efflux family protein [Mycobacterium kansasii]|uniref:Cation efflux family protein n=1 Tax=Mycobacterium kansasii TaxID=1768 RepID=A0A1V3WTC1_MYCKA|nr:cation efflux family protein [Mycobacterium kansasii]
MGAGHNHTSHAPAGADTSRMIPRMVVAAAILAAFFVVELTTALLINSIALLADAGHMLTDVVAVFMGWPPSCWPGGAARHRTAPMVGIEPRCSPR